MDEGDDSARLERVVVTGAHGFLGRHVARAVAQRGARVIGLGHGEWSREEWEAWGLSEWHCRDVSLAALRQRAGKPDVIFDCAGSGSVLFSIENPLADFERTVVSTAHVLEFVRKCAPLCRVVYPSSASVYGRALTVPISEDAVAAPISQYGTHKLMAEQMVGSYAHQFGIRTAIVRLFSVYGCGLRKQLLWDACEKFAARDAVFMGCGDEVRDWLHVEDAVQLMLLAAERASSDCVIVNGGSGAGVSVREVLQELSAALGSGGALEFSGAERAGDPSRYVAAIERSAEWGWSPQRDWRSGVAEYARWWMTECG
ncbi:MAG: NAD-dependent epimerase/dehydratase family protein [Acidobacteriota bacterium]